MKWFEISISLIGAGWFGYASFYLMRRNRNTWLIGCSLILSCICLLCSMSWFQGLFTTHVISRIQSFGEKLNDFQSVTAKMQTELEEQQGKLDEYQRALGEQQYKIIKTQQDTSSQQQSITNHVQQISELQQKLSHTEAKLAEEFKRISVMQTDLSQSQSNLLSQGSRLNDLESLIAKFYSRVTSEEFALSDQIMERLAVEKVPDGGVVIAFKLASVPIGNSIQAWAQRPPDRQTPLLPMRNFKNIAVCLLANDFGLSETTFTISYTKDIRSNGLIQKVNWQHTKTSQSRDSTSPRLILLGDDKIIWEYEEKLLGPRNIRVAPSGL